MNISLQPTVLLWARERSGLSVEALARKLQVKPEKVVDWERTGELSFNQAEKLALVTHIPFGYLYLLEPPQESLPIRDFRTLNNEGINRPSPNLLAILDQAQQIQSWFREELRTREQTPLPFVGSLSQNLMIDEAADRIRAHVGFNVRQSSHNWEEALRLQIEQIENTGVLIMRNGIVGNNTHRPLSVEEFRGFALSDAYAPLIFINGRDARAAQMFTLVHELVHIWVGVSGVSNLDKTYVEQDGVEQFCNQVAAELLVPSAELLEQWTKVKFQNDWLQSLTKQFKVSSLVILRRLNDKRLISPSTFQELYQTEQKRFQGSTNEQPGGGDFYRTQVSRFSNQFLRALVESTLEGRTPYRDALRLLGFSKIKTFHELARKLAFSI